MGQDLLPGHKERGCNQKNLSHRQSGGSGVSFRQSRISSLPGECSLRLRMVQGAHGNVHEGMREKEPVNEDLVRWTDHFWEDPEKVLLLIDLIFLGEDTKILPS